MIHFRNINKKTQLGQTNLQVKIGITEPVAMMIQEELQTQRQSNYKDRWKKPSLFQRKPDKGPEIFKQVLASQNNNKEIGQLFQKILSNL